MASQPASKVKTGTTEVPTAQTPVALCPVQANDCIGVLVQADPNNTGKAAVGDANVNAKATLGTFKGVFLKKEGEPVFIETADPASLFVDVEKSKDFVVWTLLFA